MKSILNILKEEPVPRDPGEFNTDDIAVSWNAFGLHFADLGSGEMTSIKHGDGITLQLSRSRTLLPLAKPSETYQHKLHMELRGRTGRQRVTAIVDTPDVLLGLPWFESAGGIAVELAVAAKLIRCVLGQGAKVAEWPEEEAQSSPPEHMQSVQMAEAANLVDFKQSTALNKTPRRRLAPIERIILTIIVFIFLSLAWKWLSNG